MPRTSSYISQASSTHLAKSSTIARYLSLVLIGLGVTLVICYALRVQPTIEGVDYYSNVLYARDLANGASDVSLDRYGYLPGVYTFWRFAVLVSGGSLDAVRWVYLALLGLNAALVGLVIWRVTHAVTAAFVGGFWLVLAFALYEGFQGLTEPIVTAPLLSGLLLWGGRPLQGRSGWWRALALGTGMGLALYAKQPGGLLATGAVALLIQNFTGTSDSAHDPRQLVALPAIALTVFVAAVLCEGRGLEPLRIASELLPRYVGAWPEQGHPFLVNLGIVAARDWFLWVGWIAALAVWLAVVVANRGCPAEPWVQVMGFCVVATISSLKQYELRPYLHYFLIGAPTAIIAAVLVGLAFTRRIRSAWPASLWAGVLTRSMAVLPLVAGHSGSSSPFAWNSPLPERLWRNEPQTARDLESVASLLHPGEDVPSCHPGGTRSTCWQARDPFPFHTAMAGSPNRGSFSERLILRAFAL